MATSSQALITSKMSAQLTATTHSLIFIGCAFAVGWYLPYIYQFDLLSSTDVPGCKTDMYASLCSLPKIQTNPFCSFTF